MGEGRTGEAHIAPVAAHAIRLADRDVGSRLGDRSDAVECLSVVAGRAIRGDARMVHRRAGEGHRVSVTGVAGCRLGRNVIGGLAWRERAVVAGDALPGRSLQPAIDVAGHAFDGYMSARQRKARLGVIEMRGSLSQCRNCHGNQNDGANAADPAKSIHVSPRAMQLRLNLEPNAPRGDNGLLRAIIRRPDVSLGNFSVLLQ